MCPDFSDSAGMAVTQARPVLPVYSVDERLRKRTFSRLFGKTMLFLLDAMALNVAFIAAYLLRFQLLKGVAIHHAVH